MLSQTKFVSSQGLIAYHMPLLYHIVEPEYWQPFLDKDSYIPAGYAEEGFIHLSLKEQLEGTLTKFYPDAKELVLLVISEKPVRQHLKYEPGGPEGELFPHIYAPIPIEAIEDTRMLMKDKQGKWEWI